MSFLTFFFILTRTHAIAAVYCGCFPIIRSGIGNGDGTDDARREPPNQLARMPTPTKHEEDDGSSAEDPSRPDPAAPHPVTDPSQPIRKRRKTQPHPAYDDIYVSDFGADSTGHPPKNKASQPKHAAANNPKSDPDVTAMKHSFFERLGAALILDADASTRQDVVVLQSTQNEKIMQMSPYTVLVGYFAKDWRMPEGKFRSVVMQQGGPGVERKTWRPRVHKQQVHVIQGVRYPGNTTEWDVLRSILDEATDGSMMGLPRLLEGDADVDTVMQAAQRAVAVAREFRLLAPEERPGIVNGGVGGVVGGGVGAGRQGYGAEPVFGYMPPDAPPVNSYDDVEVDSGELQQKNDMARDRPVQVAVELNVDNTTFKTTTATLLAVDNTFFSVMVENNPKSTKFFVDRSPQLFPFVLEYLREKRFRRQLRELEAVGMTAEERERQEEAMESMESLELLELLPLPTAPVQLQRHKREAKYFGVEGLEGPADAKRGGAAEADR